MNKKAQEMELKNIMQGLEEFATFMSYQSDYTGLKILSVEAPDSAYTPTSVDTPRSAQIISFENHKKNRKPVEEPLQNIEKSLHFSGM